MTHKLTVHLVTINYTRILEIIDLLPCDKAVMSCSCEQVGVLTNFLGALAGIKLALFPLHSSAFKENYEEISLAVHAKCTQYFQKTVVINMMFNDVNNRWSRHKGETLCICEKTFLCVLKRLKTQ